MIIPSRSPRLLLKPPTWCSAIAKAIRAVAADCAVSLCINRREQYLVYLNEFPTMTTTSHGQSVQQNQRLCSTNLNGLQSQMKTRRIVWNSGLHESKFL